MMGERQRSTQRLTNQSVLAEQAAKEPEGAEPEVASDDQWHDSDYDRIWSKHSAAATRERNQQAEHLQSGAQPVQRKGDRSSSLDEPEVQRVAHDGITGVGHALPHIDTIQQSFGRHVISHIQAHTDDAAAVSSSALGASAYATGDHVAFGAAPDLHTAAHEAAHVVQQRAGVPRKALDGASGDSFEQHADRVADAVVSGRSAEPLLDQIAGDGASVPVATVQRIAKPKTNEDGASKRGHEAYEPTWDDVVAAAQGDVEAKEVLDVTWIDGLDSELRLQIESSFHISHESAAAELIKKRRLVAIEKKYKADKKSAERETKARLGPKAKKTAISADAKHAASMDDLKAQHDMDIANVATEAQTEAKAHPPQLRAASTKIKPPSEVSWIEGRLLARVNFMGWGIALLGSASAVKAHFSGIHAVPGAGGLRLAKEAAARYLKARAWFENEHPGNTFRPTSTGQSLRDRHQGDHPRGKQGHPLGIALDIDVLDNPFQTDPVARFMLKQFGGTTKGDGQREEGHNRMELPSSRPEVQRMGKAMDAGHPLEAKQSALLEKADQAYQEMFETSQRFQASLKDQMPDLRRAQALYVSVVRPGRQRLVALDAELTAARAAAAKKAKGSEPGIESDPKVIVLTAEQALHENTVESAQRQVNEILQKAFAPWRNEMQAYIDQQHGELGEANMGVKIDAKVAHEAVPEIQKAKNPADLKKIYSKKKYKPLFAELDKSRIDRDFADAKAYMATRAEDVARAREQSREVGLREELIRRLADPEQVFGPGQRHKVDGIVTHTASETHTDPTVMQYLERGFVRNDELIGPGDRPHNGEPKGVFNGEFIKAMMQHGWYPGAAWDSAVDTMHFDFLDGYDKIVGSPGSDKKFGPTD